MSPETRHLDPPESFCGCGMSTPGGTERVLCFREGERRQAGGGISGGVWGQLPRPGEAWDYNAVTSWGPRSMTERRPDGGGGV